MSPYASTHRHSAPSAGENSSGSGSRRASSRKLAMRSEPFLPTRLTAASLALESFWDLGVLDRLHAPLTHYHE